MAFLIELHQDMQAVQREPNGKYESLKEKGPVKNFVCTKFLTGRIVFPVAFL